MKQTIEIEVPDGKVAVWEDGKVVFKDAPPTLPKTWLEFVETQNYEKAQIIAGVPQEIAPQHIALLQLHKLRDCYRQGWVPDYSDNNSELIWSIIKRRGVLMVGNFVYDSHFLSFPTRKLANEFMNYFRAHIEQAGDLI